MPNKRKSSASHEASGAFRKNPARARARAAEPVVMDELGPMPVEWLNDKSPEAIAHKRAWEELKLETKEVRITSGDRSLFISTCRLKVRCSRYSAKVGEFAQLKAHLVELGLTPRARSGVQGLTGGDRKAGVPQTGGAFAAIAAGQTSVPIQ